MRLANYKLLKIFIISVTLQSLTSLTVFAKETEPSGKYENMLENGNLELLGGNFPNKWNSRWAKPKYFFTGAPQGGGFFSLSGKGKQYLIRQDATLSLAKGEKYRLSAWIKTNNFQGKAGIEVYNNGWKWSEALKINSGTGKWQKYETVFTAAKSKGDTYGCAIVVRKLQKGTLDVANIRVEPATESSFKLSYAYLNEIPPQTLVPLYPRLKRIFKSDPQLTFKWFGNSDAVINFFADGTKIAELKPDAQGLINLNLALDIGKHHLSASSGDYKGKWDIEINPGFPQIKTVRKNNLHTIIAELNVKENGSGKFINPRDGWVLFRMPAGTEISLKGSKGPLVDGGFVELPAGEHNFQLKGLGAKITISSIAETFLYQLCGGPYLPKLEKNSWEIYRQTVIPYTTTFFNGDAGSRENWRIFRKMNRRMLGISDLTTMLSVKKDQSLTHVRGLNPKNIIFDGITIDEFYGHNVKMQVKFIKSSVNYTIPEGRVIYSWLTGMPTKSPISTSFMSHVVNLAGTGKLLYEAYIPSNFGNEAQAKKQIENETSKRMEMLEKIYPGLCNMFGLILWAANVPFSNTMDNNPAVNYKYFQDMQFHQLAVGKNLNGIATVGYWGCNYSDTEMSRWIGALFRHYVIEGSTELLSKKYGYTFRPGHLLNCDFANGLQSWQSTGNVSTGIGTSFPELLKRFHRLPDDGNNYVIFSNGTLSQKIQHLKTGKLYKVRFVTSNAQNISKENATGLKLNYELTGAKILPESVIRTSRKSVPAYYNEFIFRAENAEAELTLNDFTNPKGSKTSLHYISVMPYFEN